MNRPSTRIILLAMGVVSASAFIVEVVAGKTPDDALLVFSGSMFTTFALTEREERQDSKPKPKPKSKRSRTGTEAK